MAIKIEPMSWNKWWTNMHFKRL